MVVTSESNCQTDSQARQLQAKLFHSTEIMSQAQVDKPENKCVVRGIHASSTVEKNEFIERVNGLCMPFSHCHVQAYFRTPHWRKLYC